MSKLDSTLSKVVEKGIMLAEKTGQFVVEQAPDLIQEFYRWQMYKHIFIALTSGLIFFILRPILIKSFNRIKDDEEEIPDLLFVILGCVYTILAVPLFLKSTYQLIFLLSAPKLYLIEHFVGN